MDFANSSSDLDLRDRDQLFEHAALLIVMHQQDSTSLIQPKLKLGYHRASRSIDQLEATGIIVPFDGSKAHEVLPSPAKLKKSTVVTPAELPKRKSSNQQADSPQLESPEKKKSNVFVMLLLGIFTK